jgi:hypothetical protein
LVNIQVGGSYTCPSEKYEFGSWDYEIPNIWKNKKCSMFFGVPSSVLFEKKHMGGFHLGDGLEK